MGVGEGVQSTAERLNRATGSGSEGGYARACALPVPVVLMLPVEGECSIEWWRPQADSKPLARKRKDPK
jgi:hypothetical protein